MTDNTAQFDFDPQEVFRFFDANPARRYFVKILGPSPDIPGFVSLIIFTNGPRMGDTAKTVEWRPGSEDGTLHEMEAWLNSAPQSETWIERLIAGGDGSVRKDAEIQARGALALMPTDSTKH